MTKQVKQLYEFGPFLLDPAERTLLREGRPVAVTPKVLDILLVLVQHRGHLLTKKELMEAVWPDSFVEEGNLTFNVSSLRKALGEDRKEQLYIETVPRRGYRFVASVRTFEADAVDEWGGVGEARNVQEKGPVQSGGDPEPNNLNAPVAVIESGGQRADEADDGASALLAANPLYPSAPTKRRAKITVLLAIFIMMAGAIAGIYAFRGRTGVEPPALFRELKISRLTATRNATEAVISPDGKYVVYVVDEARQRSLWLRQIATNSHVQIVPAADVYYPDLFFSHDGDYVYYVSAEEHSLPALYRMPVPGGAPRKLMDNMSGSIALSPDGKRFARIRGYPGGEVALTVANAFDGSGEQKLISRQQPGFLSSLAWSPDGQVIACVAGSVTSAGRQVALIGVRVADGVEKPITSQQWKFVDRVAWLSDGGGLLVTVSDYSFGPYQIWHVSYADGEIQRVTTDLSNYRSMSLTADSKNLVAVQSDIRPYVWVAPDAEAGRAQQITSGPGTGNDYWGFSWTPDDKIVYVSTLSGNQDIWIMNSDGGDQKQLTFDGHSDFDPSVSPDGRYIAFASERSGNTQIWRMDIDGGNPKQLTAGTTADFLPTYSPDGRWVVYTSGDTRDLSLWKVPADGGEPSRLTRQTSSWPAISPDGRLIACWHADERTGSVGLAVVPAGGGEPAKLFDISPTVNTWAEIRWTSDGRALTYIDERDGAGNIWSQSLDGGPPRQLTDFKADKVFRFDRSRDGKRLVFSQGVESNDVVLISGR
jgi:Tol biopolymer transport system component/DNA-binding winged helix-turn-helix (wHTH) protein